MWEANADWWADTLNIFFLYLFPVIKKDKHAVLDITPNAVDRLNYAQWYPIVVFLNPDTKQGVKNMRTRLCPESRKSARKLYERALKLRKNNHHLFTSESSGREGRIDWFCSGRREGDILQRAKTHFNRQLTIECRSVRGHGYAALFLALFCQISHKSLFSTDHHTRAPVGPFSACTLPVEGWVVTMLQEHLMVMKI